MHYIVADSLNKTYPGQIGNKESVHVLQNVSFHVAEGEFVVLFGPNGCGKTTLLYLLAGLVTPDGGSVQIAGRPPELVSCGYVFQNYVASLLPWRTIRRNISLPLELSGINRNEIPSQVDSFLTTMQIHLPLDRFPYQLSGGQQQLVAIARALIGRPRVLFLDEPFNQLDYHSRSQLHDQLLQLWRKAKLTVVFISHDLDEALTLGDRVIFLSKLPAQVVADLSTGNPEDRTHQVIASSHFSHNLEYALEILNGAQRL